MRLRRHRVSRERPPPTRSAARAMPSSSEAAAAFDQSVGVEQQRRARRHRDMGFGSRRRPTGASAGSPCPLSSISMPPSACTMIGGGCPALEYTSSPVVSVEHRAERRGAVGAGQSRRETVEARENGARDLTFRAAAPGRRCEADPSRWRRPGRDRRSRRRSARRARRRDRRRRTSRRRPAAVGSPGGTAPQSRPGRLAGPSIACCSATAVSRCSSIW